MDKRIEKLIIKFITKEANLDELHQLELWIGNTDNEILFFDYINTNAYLTISMSDYDVNTAKGKILNRIKQEKVKRKRFPKRSVVLKYAAVAVLVFCLGYFFKDEKDIILKDNQSIMVDNQIESGSDKATLTLESGENVMLGKGNTFQTQNATSNGKEIVYKETTSAAAIGYNYLTIPRGGQYEIALTDGTRVWLNSESKLKYPTRFVEGQTREVELLYGEAYFDVSPSTAHNGSKFRVNSGIQKIEVIGTEFNIKAYRDETQIYTTLVEGKVKVVNELGNYTLQPFEQAIMDRETNRTKVKQLEKVYDEIAWKEGVFSFKNKKLRDIVNVLSRWYNADFKFENPDTEKTLFTGVLGKEQQIEQILIAIKITNNIHYEINANEITLK